MYVTTSAETLFKIYLTCIEAPVVCVCACVYFYTSIIALRKLDNEKQAIL